MYQWILPSRYARWLGGTSRIRGATIYEVHITTLGKTSLLTIVSYFFCTCPRTEVGDLVVHKIFWPYAASSHKKEINQFATIMGAGG